MGSQGPVAHTTTSTHTQQLTGGEQILARKGKNRKLRQRAQRARTQGPTSGSAAQNAASSPAPQKPTSVTSLADIGQLDINTAGLPTCQGFKVVDGEVTNVPCQFKLRTEEDRERGYCPHHIDQVPATDNSDQPAPNASPPTNPTDDSPEEEFATMSTAPASEVELVQPALDFNELDDHFDWALIKRLGLPSRDPLNMDPEEAAELLQPAALDQHVPLRTEEFLFELGDGKFCFVANPKTVEIRGRKTHYDGIIDGDSRLQMWTDVFSRVTNTVRSARAGNIDPRDLTGTELNHRMVSPTLLSYFRRLLYAAGYLARKDGQLTWATSALLSRQFAFDELIAEGRRIMEEELAYQEASAQRRAEAESDYSGMFEEIRSTTAPPAEPKTNGHGKVKAPSIDDDTKGELQQFALSILAGNGEASYQEIVLGVAQEFSDVPAVSIAEALVGMRSALEAAGIDVSL